MGWFEVMVRYGGSCLPGRVSTRFLAPTLAIPAAEEKVVARLALAVLWLPGRGADPGSRDTEEGSSLANICVMFPLIPVSCLPHVVR